MQNLGIELMAGSAILSLFVVATSSLRLFFKKQIPKYDFFEEWAGHGTHGIANFFMAISMFNVVTPLLEHTTLLFYTFALVFLVKGLLKATRKAEGAGSELIHSVVCFIMFYMMMGPNEWIRDFVILSIICLAALCLLYIYRLVKGLAVKPEERLWATVGNLNHLAMLFSMIIMFVVMRWPSQFGLDHMHH